MEHLFWRHTSQTTPSDPARCHRSQVVKLTSAGSIGHLTGHNRAHGATTSPWRSTVCLKAIPGLLLRQGVF